MSVRRLGLLTGGGDCPGLNAVIRAVTKTAVGRGAQVVGIHDGFLGLIHDRCRELSTADVSNILTVGGTVLGTSNRANPFRFVDKPGDKPADVSERCVRTIRARGLDGLVVVGGDGTMTIASDLARVLEPLGLPIVGIPKTIDNDLYGTDLTFGFLTAVEIATQAIDRVHTTAASHHRVMVVEVMGRNAGWIALFAGLASGADVILIPEMPFSFGAIEKAIAGRRAQGKTYSIVCVAEGARPAGGEQQVARVDPLSPDPVRLGGVGKFVADTLERATGHESRYVVLGHVQRGGTPVAPDRVLGTRFGHAAVELLLGGARNRMIALRGVTSAGSGTLHDVELSLASGRQRLVPVRGSPEGEHPLIAAARAVGTSFGEQV